MASKQIQFEPGQVLGRLTFVGRVSGSESQFTCSCGNAVRARNYRVYWGETRSCGCLRKEVCGALNLTHGLSHKHPLYELWANMRDRCNRPAHRDYHLYGGRGVRVHPDWDDFEKFAAHVGSRPSPQHSLDRERTNGDYEPGNVRWATPTVQARNKRNNVLFELDGKEKTLGEWAEGSAVPYRTLYTRINRQGLALREALTARSRYSRSRSACA